MPAPSFADVLDDALAQARGHARRTVAWSAAATRDVRDPFVYARPLSAGAAWTRSYARPAASPPPPPRPPQLPARRLSADEQLALARLLALGAALTEFFTAADLKREYRRLALRHHPDRQGAAAGTEPAAAAATFAAVAEAYHRLRLVVDARN